MREYEIYIPTSLEGTSSPDEEEIQRIKDLLIDAFGGYTHLNHTNEGAWKAGGVTVRDAITIVRVLDDGSAQFDMRHFKKELERALKQDSILIIARDVEAIR